VRVAFVIGGIPALGHSGSTIASWIIISKLLEAGHHVTAVLLPAPYLLDASAEERFAELERLGATVRVIDVPQPPSGRSKWQDRASFVRSIARPRDEELLPAARARDKVHAAIADSHVGLAFGIEAIAATAGAPIPILAALSHPPGVARRLRARYARSERTVLGRASERSFLVYADRRAGVMLRRFPSVAVFSRHHAEWAARHGANAWYAHYPMPDLAGPDWRERRATGKPNPKPRILMIGHLRGIGTISGFHLFVPEILPRLTDALGEDGFEVHVVGGQEPPEEFREGLDHPSVLLRGQITDPSEEFFRADVLLAPNPTVTGASARILSGLTFGSCIVAHTDSLVGIPELVHGVNSLLAADGRSLAEETLRALADASLRDRLGAEARALYERAFEPEVAVGRLVAELERLSASPRAQAAAQDAEAKPERSERAKQP
jgi:glycosyltransferase involved in cell wall biosynthesis